MRWERALGFLKPPAPSRLSCVSYAAVRDYMFDIRRYALLFGKRNDIGLIIPSPRYEPAALPLGDKVVAVNQK